MKKNIEKPVLNEQALRVLSAQFAAIWEMAIKADKGLKRKQRRKIEDFIDVLVSMIHAGAWETAFRVSYHNKTFDESFRSSLCVLLTAEREHYNDYGEGNRYEDIKCGALKIAKAYEYCTGKDPMTNKRLHKGALDAES